MIKATDKWFRLLKGIPLNEQEDNVEQLVQTFKAAYKKDTGMEYSDEEWLRQYAEKNPKGLAGEIKRMGGAVDTAQPSKKQPAAEKPTQKITCPEGVPYDPKTKKCLRQMSMPRQEATKKVQQIAKVKAEGQPAVKFAQSVVGDIIFGDAHLPEEKRKLDIDGFVGPDTLRAFANVGIDPSFIGEEPEDRKNWRMATENIEVIRNALAEKYNAALPHIGVDTEKAVAAAQAVKMTAKRVAKTMAEPDDITGEGKAEVPSAKWHGKIALGKGRRKLSSIKTIVLHDTLTGFNSMIRIFNAPQTFTSKTGKQSTYFTGTHFSITNDGTIRQHAPLNVVTNHTATGTWSNRSVGIDLVTMAGGVGGGYIGYKPPTSAQLNSLHKLVGELQAKIPSIVDEVHWLDKGEKNNFGWDLKGKRYSPSNGIVSHGMVQGNRADATISAYYLKLRKEENLSHADAYEKAIAAEEQARLHYANTTGARQMKRLQKIAKRTGKTRKQKRRIRSAKRKLAGIERIRTAAAATGQPTSAVTEGIKIKIGEKKTLTEEWWDERRGLDNKAFNKNLGKEYRKMKHVKKGGPFRCNPPSKIAGGIKPTKGSKC